MHGLASQYNYTDRLSTTVTLRRSLRAVFFFVLLYGSAISCIYDLVLVLHFCCVLECSR